MVTITLVSLLHSLGPRFPVYSTALLLPLVANHQGDLWLPPIKGADITALEQQGQGAKRLASLAAGWCDFAASGAGETPGQEGLASYDEEMLENLQLYWHSPAKINSPITDNLFELRRGVVDEVHGQTLAVAWEQQQQLRFTQLMAAVAAGRDQLCFVEVESAYWLRQKLSEQSGITLCQPAIG